MASQAEEQGNRVGVGFDGEAVARRRAILAIKYPAKALMVS